MVKKNFAKKYNLIWKAATKGHTNTPFGTWTDYTKEDQDETIRGELE